VNSKIYIYIPLEHVEKGILPSYPKFMTWRLKFREEVDDGKGGMEIFSTAP